VPESVGETLGDSTGWREAEKAPVREALPCRIRNIVDELAAGAGGEIVPCLLCLVVI